MTQKIDQPFGVGITNSPAPANPDFVIAVTEGGVNADNSDVKDVVIDILKLGSGNTTINPATTRFLYRRRILAPAEYAGDWETVGANSMLSFTDGVPNDKSVVLEVEYVVEATTIEDPPMVRASSNVYKLTIDHKLSPAALTFIILAVVAVVAIAAWFLYSHYCTAATPVADGPKGEYFSFSSDKGAQKIWMDGDKNAQTVQLLEVGATPAGTAGTAAAAGAPVPVASGAGTYTPPVIATSGAPVIDRVERINSMGEAAPVFPTDVPAAAAVAAQTGNQRFPHRTQALHG